jgi:uncharacterized membrane protein YhaH (DUF805 family)
MENNIQQDNLGDLMAANPYTPPRSQVADVGTDEVQEVRIFSTKGRIGRLRYLAYTSAGSFAIMFVAGFVGAFIGASAVPVITLIAYIPLIIFGVMCMIQRSHDMNWSGWMCFLGIIPFVGLIWLFKSGTQGENDYGAPPPPNTTGVKILAFTVPVIAVIGILAAIAIPAYQDYVMRAQQGQ